MVVVISAAATAAATGEAATGEVAGWEGKVGVTEAGVVVRVEV